MNYNKKQTYQKQKDLTAKSTHQSKRVGVRLYKALLLCILGAIIIAMIGGLLLLKKVIDDAPEATPEDIKPQKYTSFAYADDGTTVLDRFNSEGSNRIYKEIKDIPKDLQHAFVAIEDERFYTHKGIDPAGIARAGFIGLTTGNFSEGASTLTQQLIKNTLYPDFIKETKFEKVERKLQEQYLALKIEKSMTKDQILEYYMNTVNLGQNTLGVQTASKRYFNKDVSDLTLSECATIAAITQNPSHNNPINNPEKNNDRRQKILNNMLEQGYIDQAAKDEAAADDVYTRIQTVNSAIVADSPNTYFIDALSEQVMQNLQTQLNYSKNKAYNAVYGGGLSIYSTQNQYWQTICDEEMNNDENYPWKIEYGLNYALTVTRADGSIENYGSHNIRAYAKETLGREYGLVFSSPEDAENVIASWKATIAREGDGYDEQYSITPQPQASLTLMDQKTGQIKAMVGGRGQKSTSQSLNRAYKGSKRQPGSAFKIVTTYAPALDTDEITLATKEVDEPVTLSDGKVLVNAYSGYRGSMTIRDAIIDSTNTVAVKVSDQITQELGVQYAEKLGITTLIRSKEINGQLFSDLHQTLALGGITEGVYNYQLCAAYAAIANNGKYNEPTLYTKVLDHDGNVLLDGTGESRQAIKDSTAYLLTSAMRSVVTEGTGTQYNIGDMPIAGKTGTTSNNIDYWFAGYTPYLTCTIWAGYDDNKPVERNFIPNIWNKVMSRIHENMEVKDFEMPDSVEETSICTITGKLANENGSCPGIKEFYAKDSLPIEECPGHYYQRKETTPSTTTPSTDSANEGEATENDSSTTETPEGGETTPPADGGTETAPPAEGETEAPAEG
ncbi:MAG TPA: transglycosylase domain-containing protein [Candidatus Dorea intestinavium]|nr:transglycosylase domain-containing protein [Candidatus Dorea intestinavium]